VELVEHLGELRARLVVSLVAVAAGFGVAYAYHDRLVTALTAALPPGHRHPVTLGVAEPFTTSLRVSLVGGLALALPVVLWELWSFLAPAFERRRARVVGLFVAAATLLFAGGVCFGYRVALPAAVHFLTGYDTSVYDVQVRASAYVSFALAVLVAVGLVFELPVLVLALVGLGVTSSERLRRSRRVGYVAMVALAVALPGVDPVTTALEAVPLVVLYEASIWLSVLMERRRATATTRPRASRALG
jgi:sec-independent protein translocase protein TatC